MVINSDIAYMIARQRATELAALAAREARVTRHTARVGRTEMQRSIRPLAFRTRVLALWAAVVGGAAVAGDAAVAGEAALVSGAQARAGGAPSPSGGAPSRSGTASAGTTPMGCVA